MSVEVIFYLRITVDSYLVRPIYLCELDNWPLALNRNGRSIAFRGVRVVDEDRGRVGDVDFPLGGIMVYFSSMLVRFL